MDKLRDQIDVFRLKFGPNTSILLTQLYLICRTERSDLLKYKDLIDIRWLNIRTNFRELMTVLNTHNFKELFEGVEQSY